LSPAELVLRVANWVKKPRNLELDFDPNRVVVRQSGRRISSTSGPSIGLTNGGYSPDLRVQLEGFRPDLPYTVTADVLAEVGANHVPVGWRRPLRFHWQLPAVAG
jgi:hypothetical protein